MRDTREKLITTRRRDLQYNQHQHHHATRGLEVKVFALTEDLIQNERVDMGLESGGIQMVNKKGRGNIRTRRETVLNTENAHVQGCDLNPATHRTYKVDHQDQQKHPILYCKSRKYLPVGPVRGDLMHFPFSPCNHHPHQRKRGRRRGFPRCSMKESHRCHTQKSHFFQQPAIGIAKNIFNQYGKASSTVKRGCAA